MQQYIRTRPGHETRVVTQEEVLYVMKVADRLGTGEIGATEVAVAVATWKALVADQQELDAKFGTYDRDSNGSLTRSQVREVLTDMNGGVTPTEDELDWVIKKADGKADGELDGRVDPGELRVALAVWYCMHAERKRKPSCAERCCGGRGPVEGDTRSGSHLPVRENQWQQCRWTPAAALCFLCSRVRASM